MRVLLTLTSTALCSFHGAVAAAPLRACEQVWKQVQAAVGPLLTGGTAGSQQDPASINAQFHACVTAHNICGVVDDSRQRKPALVAGDVTGDLPPRTGQAASSVVVLVRSIPRLRTDSNQYCLVSSQSREVAAAPQWAVYGWVIAPNAGEALPLQRELLEDPAVSEPISLRGRAAALWFFAQRMSGQPPPAASRREPKIGSTRVAVHLSFSVPLS